MTPISHPFDCELSCGEFQGIRNGIDETPDELVANIDW